MSRILDYVLEPNVVYTNGAFLIKVKVQDDYKYKKYLVSESMKYTTATGTTFTLTNAVSTNNASILQLQGNTSQTGTPTPTSPVEVKTVSGDNEVVVCGKNLLDIQTVEKGRLDSGVLGYANGTSDLTLNSNSFTFTTTTYWRGVTSGYIGVKTVTQYIYSSDFVFDANSLFLVACYDNKKNWLGNASVLAGSTNYERKFTTLSNTSFVRINIQVRNASTTTISNPQLELGSTATTYEAYTGNSYRVDFGGKNILPNTATTQTINGITFTVNEDKTITLNGTSTNAIELPIGMCESLDIGTYKGNCTSNSSTSSYYIRLGTNNTSSSGWLANVTYNTTVTLNSITNVYALLIVRNGVTVNNITIYPQLEKRKYSNRVQSLCI